MCWETTDNYADFDIKPSKSYIKNVYPKINYENFLKLIKHQETHFVSQHGIGLDDVTGISKGIFREIMFGEYNKILLKRYNLNKNEKKKSYRYTYDEAESLKDSFRSGLKIIKIKDKYINDIIDRIHHCELFQRKLMYQRTIEHYYTDNLNKDISNNDISNDIFLDPEDIHFVTLTNMKNASGITDI